MNNDRKFTRVTTAAAEIKVKALYMCLTCDDDDDMMMMVTSLHLV